MNTPSVEKMELRQFKVPLTPNELHDFRRVVIDSGYKQQAWMRQAILEKIAREAAHADDQR